MEDRNSAMLDSPFYRSNISEVSDNKLENMELGKECFDEFSDIIDSKAAAALDTLLDPAERQDLGTLKARYYAFFQPERHAEPLHLFYEMVTTRRDESIPVVCYAAELYSKARAFAQSLKADVTRNWTDSNGFLSPDMLCSLMTQAMLIGPLPSTVQEALIPSLGCDRAPAVYTALAEQEMRKIGAVALPAASRFTSSTEDSSHPSTGESSPIQQAHSLSLSSQSSAQLATRTVLKSHNKEITEISTHDTSSSQPSASHQAPAHSGPRALGPSKQPSLGKDRNTYDQNLADNSFHGNPFKSRTHDKVTTSNTEHELKMKIRAMYKKSSSTASCSSPSAHSGSQLPGFLLTPAGASAGDSGVSGQHSGPFLNSEQTTFATSRQAPVANSVMHNQQTSFRVAVADKHALPVTSTSEANRKPGSMKNKACGQRPAQAWRPVPPDLFVPKPAQCHRCLRFFHVQKDCSLPAYCPYHDAAVGHSWRHCKKYAHLAKLTQSELAKFAKGKRV